MPIREMEALYKRANLPDATVDLVKEVIKTCKQCRLWDRLPARNIVKQTLASLFNDRVWLDILFCTVFCEGPARDCTNLHLLDEASFVCMLPLLTGRSFGAIRVGMTRWTEPWGFPARCVADGEKAVGSEAMKS